MAWCFSARYFFFSSRLADVFHWCLSSSEEHISQIIKYTLVYQSIMTTSLSNLHKILWLCLVEVRQVVHTYICDDYKHYIDAGVLKKEQPRHTASPEHMYILHQIWIDKYSFNSFRSTVLEQIFAILWVKDFFVSDVYLRLVCLRCDVFFKWIMHSWQNSCGTHLYLHPNTRGHLCQRRHSRCKRRGTCKTHLLFIFIS